MPCASRTAADERGGTTVTVETLVYDADGVRAWDGDGLGSALAARGTTWIRVVDPTPGEVEAVREACGVHPLTIEDVENNVRPKVEEFDDYVFVLAKGARLTREETTFQEELVETPLGLFFGRDWLVTFAREEPPAVERVWSVVRREDDRVLGRGPDFAAYRVIDGLVDGYFDLLDQVESRIERIEEELTDTPGRATLAEINSARRELLSIRKLLWPTREAVGYLARGDPPQVRETTEKYYRDVYDHLVQLVDLVETYRDLAAGARDIYLNVLSISTNEVMKRLTVVATVVLPLTFVVGVYGMNVQGGVYGMPELGWDYTYPAVLLGMLGIAAVLVWHFRREEWL